MRRRRPWWSPMTSAWDRADLPAWGIDALDAGGRGTRRRAHRCRSSTRLRRPRSIYTSGTTGPGQRRGDHARQPLRERADAGRCLALHRRRSSPAGAAALPRARPRQRRPLLAAVRLPHAAARTLRATPPPPRRCATSVPRSSSACRRCTCGCWKWSGRRRARSAAHSGCACRARRRCRRRCSRTSRRCSVSASSSATA